MLVAHVCINIGLQNMEEKASRVVHKTGPGEGSTELIKGAAKGCKGHETSRDSEGNGGIYQTHSGYTSG